MKDAKKKQFEVIQELRKVYSNEDIEPVWNKIKLFANSSIFNFANAKLAILMFKSDGNLWYILWKKMIRSKEQLLMKK